MGTRAQAEWLLKAETILGELMKMAEDDDADVDLKRSVLGPQTTAALLAKFPLVLKQKLISSAKSFPTKEKLEVFTDKIKEWSKTALEMEKYMPDTKSSKKAPTSKGPVTIKIPQVQLFNPPKPLPTCKICVELQKK